MVDVVGRYGKPRYPEKDLDQLQHILARATGGPRAKSKPTATKIRNITRRLGAERIERLAVDYLAGEPTTVLMHTYGLSKSSVLQLLEASGVELRRQPLAPDKVAEVVRLYRDEGCSLSTIVTRLGYPRESVRRSLIDAGVTMRGRGGWNRSTRRAPSL